MFGENLMCNIILYPCITVDLNIDLSVNHIKGHIKIAILWLNINKKRTGGKYKKWFKLDLSPNQLHRLQT